MPLPVILEQNHITEGDKQLFPKGKSQIAEQFEREGHCPSPAVVLQVKFQFVLLLSRSLTF